MGRDSSHHMIVPCRTAAYGVGPLPSCNIQDVLLFKHHPRVTVDKRQSTKKMRSCERYAENVSVGAQAPYKVCESWLWLTPCFDTGGRGDSLVEKERVFKELAARFFQFNF